MYNASSLFLQDIKKASRNVKCKVIIGSTEITEEQVMNFQIEDILSNEALPGIGGVISSKLTLNMIRDGKTPSYYTNQTIKPYVAIQLTNNQQWEYIPLGVFKPKPDSVKKTDYQITVECEDILTWLDGYDYDSKLNYPVSASSVLTEMETMFGVSFVKTGLPTATVKVKPDKNPRTALSEIAELFGSNLIVNRTGLLEFKKQSANNQTLTDENYSEFKLLSDDRVSITKLIVEKGGQDDSGNEIPDIEVGNTTGATLRLKNDSITTQAELQKVYNYAYPITYWSYELKCQGMPHFDVGDRFTLIDHKQVSRELIVLEHKLSFNGGLISNIKANAPKTEMKAGSTGSNSISSSLTQAQMDVLNVQHILAGNITADNIKANSITADKIDANTITSDLIDAVVIQAINASIENAVIDSAKIDVAEITTIVAQDIKVGNAQITDLEAEKIKTGNLIADVMTTNVINAVNANISNATIDSAKIGELSADKITASVIEAINLSAGKISADRIDAKDLVVDNIDAGKITTGTLDANRIGAGTIDASKITIGDFTNYVIYKPNSKFKENTNGQEVPTIFLNNNNFQISNKLYDMRGGEQFHVKGRVYTLQAPGTLYNPYNTADPIAGEKTPYVDFVWRDNAGAYISGRQVHITGLVQGEYKDFSLSSVAIPPKPTNATYLQVKLQIDTASPAGQFHFFGLTINKKNGGELIVDGAITADKIGANAITTDKLDAKAITAEKIDALAITTEKIDAKAITADKIATGAITADKIEAGTITSKEINTDTLNAVAVNASDITANKIASGEIKVGNANIIDGTISGAKISKATITEAQIQNATITDASIKSLNASKINAGELSATRIKGGTLDASTITVKNLNADSITTGSITVQGENLIHNSSFKEGFKYWVGDSGMNSSIDTVNVISPDADSVKITSTSNHGYVSEAFACNPGETFVSSVYVKTTSTNAKNNIRLFLIFRDANNTDLAPINTSIAPVLDANSGWVRYTCSFTAPANTAKVLMKFRSNGTFEGYFTQPMLSRGTLASVWKEHNDELISDGAIDNDKLGDEAVSSSKLMTDELFVGDNAFISKLKAVEINASNITTGTISNERIDITGLISFEAFDKTLQPIFDVQGDKTYINGGMIATNTIKADKIDLLSGITVKGPDGTDTFAIGENGDVNVNGLLQSGNYAPGKLGYQITPDGLAELNQATIRGDIMLPNVGLTNYASTIGNENILLNSNFSKGLDYWVIDDMSSGGTSKSVNVASGGDWVPPGYKVVEIRGTNTTNRYGVRSSQYTLKPETKYTISGYCAGHRTGSIQVNIRDINASSANIHTKNYSPVSGGNDFEKWTRFETTFTTTTNTVFAVNLYSQNMADNGYVWFGQIKLEEGEGASPWSANPSEFGNPVRIWAGKSYEQRNDAPFQVLHDGSMIANDGRFNGKLFGELNSGFVHIHNDTIELNRTNTFIDEYGIEQILEPLDGDTNGYVKFSMEQATINTPLSLNQGAINYSIADSLLGLTDTDFRVNSPIGTVLVNSGDGAFGGLNIIGPSSGHHILRGSTSNDKLGTLVFDSEGNQGQRGDFSFTRKNYKESCKVDIDGSLTVKESINSPKQNIEIRSVEGKGWGFYAT